MRPAPGWSRRSPTRSTPTTVFDDAEHSRYSHNTALAGSAVNYLVAVYAQKLSGSAVSSLLVTIKAQTDAHEMYDGDDYALPQFARRGAAPGTGRSSGGLTAAAVLFGLLLVRRRS